MPFLCDLSFFHALCLFICHRTRWNGKHFSPQDLLDYFEPSHFRMMAQNHELTEVVEIAKFLSMSEINLRENGQHGKHLREMGTFARTTKGPSKCLLSFVCNKESSLLNWLKLQVW